MKCTKGLHEMTEDNTYYDQHERRHCRECKRKRKREYYRRGQQGAGRGGHHKAVTFDKEHAPMETLPADITWRRKNNGVWVATSVNDPHAETGAQRAWDERMAREELRLERMQDEAAAVAERFRQHRADNTPLMSSARRAI